MPQFPLAELPLDNDFKLVANCQVSDGSVEFTLVRGPGPAGDVLPGNYVITGDEAGALAQMVQAKKTT